MSYPLSSWESSYYKVTIHCKVDDDAREMTWTESVRARDNHHAVALATRSAPTAGWYIDRVEVTAEGGRDVW